MSGARKPRTVYSTDRGRVCPKCGWPAKSCRCSSRTDEAVPDRITARLRIEKAGRKGKTVTVVESLPRNPAFLKDLAGELKRTCGSGGKAGETHIEIQGDHRDKIRDHLRGKGWVVKG
jgi:translation initiation factor 1